MSTTYSKDKIEELIDSKSNVIGQEDQPDFSVNNDSIANKTTDYNAKVHGQNFKNDFLGRFGFYFYESEEDANKLQSDLAILMYDKFLSTLEYYYKNPDHLEPDYNKHFADGVNKAEMLDDTDNQWAEKVMDIIEPHLRKSINEEVVGEDKIKKKRDDKWISKKKDDKEIISKDDRLKKVAGLLDKLSDKEVDKLISLLEKKKSK